jgi:DNA primase large subunit
MEPDQRLLPLLGALSRRTGDVDYRKLVTTERVLPEEIDALEKTSFPLCMSELHQKLRRDHHLEHQGRLHYGLFLKAIGLSLEDALTFWRAEFTRKMTLNKFEAQYASNIRFNYGKGGKGTDYSPFACAKIIQQGGCPLKDTGNPQEECSKIFKDTHPGAPDVFIKHPNSYYNQSRKLLGGDKVDLI